MQTFKVSPTRRIPLSLVEFFHTSPALTATPQLLCSIATFRSLAPFRYGRAAYDRLSHRQALIYHILILYKSTHFITRCNRKKSNLKEFNNGLSFTSLWKKVNGRKNKTPGSLQGEWKFLPSLRLGSSLFNLLYSIQIPLAIDLCDIEYANANL